MGLFTPSPPQPTVQPVAAATPAPKRTDPEVTRAKLDQRRRSLANFGRGSTIATSVQGLQTEASGARKTLLGT